MAAAHATAATVYPVVSGSDIRSARVEDLVIEGNKEANPHLNGCRGAGIYLYRGFGVVIQGCVVRNYHGDGISFQQSNDVTVTACVSEDNTHLGLHPGSGSQRPVVRDCLARRNGTDGLFLCWRVRHGVFEDNRLEDNGQFGISIGHKDSDNLLRGNQVAPERLERRVLPRRVGGDVAASKSLGAERDRRQRPATRHGGHPNSRRARRARSSKATRSATHASNLRADANRRHPDRSAKVGSVRLDQNQIEAGVLIDDRREGHVRAGSRE